MKEIVITTQAELDAVAADFDGLIIIRGGSHYDPIRLLEAWGSAHVEAWGSAHVEAWGSAHVVARGSAHVEARGSAHVVAWESAHVEARESAHVVARESAHVEARGSAHVVAWGGAHVEARESAHVEASKWTTVRKMLQHRGTIEGGIVALEPEISTAEDWCAYHGVTIKDGVAIVYKAVRDDYRSQHGFLYPLGGSPECADWDGGSAECGGGLHFSPSPGTALSFDGEATRFLACPVAISDMRVPKLNDQYPLKIKARRITGPISEVDIEGNPLKAKSDAAIA